MTQSTLSQYSFTLGVGDEQKQWRTLSVTWSEWVQIEMGTIEKSVTQYDMQSVCQIGANPLNEVIVNLTPSH